MPEIVEDPSPSNFWKLFLIVAVVLLIVSMVVLILGKFIVAGIIALLGAVFGLSGQVARNNQLK